MITIRKTESTDIEAALEVYAIAKQYMRRSGNANQWAGEYPGRADIARDIAAGNSYVGVDSNGRIRFVFAFILGEDSTYHYIEGGQWLNSAPYGTIHRIASDGSTARVVEAACRFCSRICANIRIDTHADNQPMQTALLRCGFTRCGIIYLADGAPRVAFQKVWQRPRLWLFNPENDIALAHGSARFTPPMAAVQLARSGATLPFWLADKGDRVLCRGVNDRWLADIQSRFGIEAEPWDGSTDLAPSPWGWSHAARQTFIEAGFDPSQLPSDNELDTLRRLSHRRTSALVANALQPLLPFAIWPAAREAFTTDDIAAAVAAGPCVVKAPWSSSGRGIAFVDADTLPKQLSRFAGTIRRQGSVMVERQARRLLDFAMLFDYSYGHCQFVGYSVFDTMTTGAYTGNYVEPQDRLLDRITAHVPAEHIVRLQTAMPQALAATLGTDYRGPVGVDMLVADTPDGPMLHAVVEVNLRYTMGRVAIALHQRTGRVGRFTITPGTASTTSSAICLTPPGADFAFTLQ